MNTLQELNRRNSSIDIIRGLCILSVILLHLNIHFGLANTFLVDVLPKRIFSLLFWSGFYGVVVFFTLSGYLITRSIIGKWGTASQIDLRTFYWFRFSRIIPLLLTLLVVLSILHIASVEGYVIDEKQTSLVRAFIAALTFHINLLEIKVGYLPASWDILWSISIEEIFYLFFPLICLVLKNEINFAFILMFFLVLSPWARTSLYPGNELADKNHLAYIDCLALGCMAAIVASRVTLSKRLNQILLVLGCLMIVMVLYFRSIVYQSGLTELGLNVTILSVGVSLVLLWLHQNHHAGNAKDWLIFRWLKHMGHYSYEIYLTHMFIVITASWIFKRCQLGSEYLIPACLIVILIAYLLGQMVFRYFSEPINLWLRDIKDRKKSEFSQK